MWLNIMFYFVIHYICNSNVIELEGVLCKGFMKSNISRNRWSWGFSEGAESWNGRLAMIAFFIIFLFELIFSFSILSLLGI